MPEVKVTTLAELQEQLERRGIDRIKLEGNGELWIAAGGIKLATGSSIAEAVGKLLAKLN